MIQGGGFTEDMAQKPTRDSIKNEADNGLTNDMGTVAMARTPDPHSAGSQLSLQALGLTRQHVEYASKHDKAKFLYCYMFHYRLSWYRLS